METTAEVNYEPTGKDIDRYLDMINPPKSVGRYQAILFTIIVMICSASFIMSMQAVYFGYTPPHHCTVDNMSLVPEEYNELAGVTAPSSCTMYVNLTSNGTNETSAIVSCQNGWTYDRSQYEETLISEFDLVCDKATYFSTIFTVSSILSGISTPIFSYLADRYGRRKVFIASFIIDRLAGFAFAFMPTLPLVSATIGLASVAAGEAIPILILYEFFPMRYRGFAGTALNLIYICLACLLPLTGHLIRQWRTLVIVWNTIATIFGLIGFWFVPESLTWLLSSRKVNEAEKLIRKIAKFNRITLEEPILTEQFLMKANDDYGRRNDDVDDGDDDADGDADDRDETRKVEVSRKKTKKYSEFGELIRSKTMIKISVIFSGLYLVNCIIFSGLLFITPYLIGDMHLNNFLMTIVELPAYLIAVFVVPRFGRKLPTIVYMVIAGIGLLLSLIELIKFEEPPSWIPIATALIGKFGISGSYAVIYVYSPELYPTKLRSTGVAVCRISEIIAQILVPYSSFYLATFGSWIPRVLYGCLSILMAIPVILLPETKEKPLPETIREIEEW